MAGNLKQLLAAREAAGKPLRVGLIGAGKLGAQFINQIGRIPGVHLMGVADIALDHAHAAMQRCGWPPERYAAKSFADAVRAGTTFLTEDAEQLIAADGMEVVVEATGQPSAGIKHALQAIELRRHIIMLTAEADIIVGPLLARRAEAAGVVYGMAYGDQPALICELVEWAQASGFDVVCAGKGVRHREVFHTANPDNVWQMHGFSQERIARGEDNPFLYTSFIDGTKANIEMALVANGTGLIPQPEGLLFPACGVDDLPTVMRPRNEGGVLSHKGTVETACSLHPDGSPVKNDIHHGVFVIVEAENDFVARSMAEYGVKLDPSGRYMAMYRPYHLVGMELPVSVLRAGLQGLATGSSLYFTADVVAKAKRNLAVNEVLDGEGGYMVRGALRPAHVALPAGELPVGLAYNMRLKTAIPEGGIVHWSDVEYDESDPLIALRREMEAGLGGP